VFAGAAREAVFSQPEVIRRVRAEFVPVALKAALVNNPPDGEEGQLYGEIGRSKPAPQGICVLNPAGKVLDWVLMFDDDASVLGFLDHARKRFARYPDAKQPVPAERFQKFPSGKLEDVADTRTPLPADARHASHKLCPGTPPVLPGTVIARLFGRALDLDGKPVADTVRQEHYVEDRFPVPVEMQDRLAKALAASAGQRFRLPEALTRLFVSHAYLGQLDVNPVAAPGGKGGLGRSEFWAQRAGGSETGPIHLRVEGSSEAAGRSSPGEGGDGRMWEHEVRLAWEGWIDLEGNRIRRLVLVARGSEKLRWGHGRNGPWAEADVTHLPGGHPIDLACGVRYGILGEPATADQVAADAPPDPAGLPVAPVPDEARRQLVEALGPPFLIFRDKVQGELRLSSEQRERVGERLARTIQDAQAFFQKMEAAAPDEREKEVQAYRQRTQERLADFLEGALRTEQRARLRQLMLQQEGAFALGNPTIGNEVQLTEAQRKQFMSLVQELQGKVQSLVREAQSGGNPEKIRPKMMRLRQDYEQKIEALLNDAQKRRWKELLGEPFDLAD
jgi:hypothetical protein